MNEGVKEFVAQYWGVLCFFMGCSFGGVVTLVFMCCLYYARDEGDNEKRY